MVAALQAAAILEMRLSKLAGLERKKLEEELAAPDAWDTPDKSAQNTERHTAAKRAVEEAYARWEAASA